MEALRFKWSSSEVRVVNIEQREVEDLAFCAYLSRKHPLWHKGLLVCACSDILDSRSIASKFLREGVVLMEQACYAYMPEYKRAIRVSEADAMVITPVIKAYGVFRALAEEVQQRAR
ncbi:MAG: hypothetical protein N3H31_04150 [Candidatus Nezhaarchaeota archaeon]|nr:hypothetical protein [Candidatus Nezhaarchaeota archaeon]